MATAFLASPALTSVIPRRSGFVAAGPVAPWSSVVDIRSPEAGTSKVVSSPRGLARQRGNAGQRRDAAVDQSRERDDDGHGSSGHCGLVAGAQRRG